MRLPLFSLARPLPIALIISTLFVSSGFAGSSPKVLHMFSGNDGGNPTANLIADKAGNLYGTTEYGGFAGYYGTIFRLSPPAVAGGHWTNTTLYTFTNTGDGARPTSGLLLDSAGNLYGTTSDSNAGGYGEIFRLTPPASGSGAWSETVLYSFKGSESDGAYPQGGLVSDPDGNLFGTTSSSVFELSPPSTSGGTWTFKQLHAFQCCTPDGWNSQAGLVRDRHGNLYGTTEWGGFFDTDYCGYLGCGTVFELRPPAQPGGAWIEHVLYRFKSNIGGYSDGFIPLSSLILDPQGNLYGNTYSGGSLGGGTVFELSPPTIKGEWAETILHEFSYTPTDGAVPIGSLIFDNAGNLYGVTEFGGNPCRFNAGAYGCGTIFKLTPTQNGSWDETVLYFFHRTGSLPRNPQAGFLMDQYGTLYGTTTYGGEDAKCGELAPGCGTVFQFTP
jgi:uncharacterized repeat protein (TIGR03803 family)